MDLTKELILKMFGQLELICSDLEKVAKNLVLTQEMLMKTAESLSPGEVTEEWIAKQMSQKEEGS